MKPTLRLLTLLSAAGLLLSSMPASAQAPIPERMDQGGKMPSKVASAVRQAATGSKIVTPGGVADLGPSSKLPADNQERLLTYVVLDAETFTPDLREALTKLNVKIDLVNEKWHTVQAWVPKDKLDEVAALPGIKRISPPDLAVRQESSDVRPAIGSITSPGDTILKADQVRARGFNGSGVNIGVLSDSASPSSLAGSRSTGDLGPVTVLKAGSGEDEGTAMLEIVHDLAPGAGLGFYGPTTSLDMAVGVQRLANEVGAKVIVDDLSFPSAPWFEDGDLANSIRNTINSKDVVYATAAGNRRQGHFYGQFTGAGSASICGAGTGRNLDRFPNGSTRLPFHHVGGTIQIIMQWATPFNNPASDYDLYLCDANGTTVIAASNDAQTPGGSFPAIEAIVGGLSAGNYSLVIDKYNGADAPVELLVYPNASSEAFLNGGATLSNGITGGQQALNEVLCTAAIDASQPPFNQTEDFSEVGPAHIYFPNRADRAKPDITGIDGVDTTVPGFAPFFGTSAASPHIAAIAALLRQAAPTASASQIRDAIHGGAVDIEAPGYDFTSGYGRADALASLNLLSAARSAVVAYLESPSAGATVRGTITLSGYAIDKGAPSGTGVNRVDIYLDGPYTTGRFLGTANYGIARGDVGSFFGSQFTNSGYQLSVNTNSLGAGAHSLYVYVFSTVNGGVTLLNPTPFTVSPSSQVVAYVEHPQSGQTVNGVTTISGYAIDIASTDSTSGVDRVDVYLDGTYATGRFIGVAQYGLSRPDVGGYFGNGRWNNSGWQIQLSTYGLPAGGHGIYAYARSKITGQYTQLTAQGFYVNNGSVVQIAIGKPAQSSTVNGTINISGWAVDLGSLNGPGINRVDIYLDGNYATGRFLGVAQFGISRSDVASYFNNSRFTNSGFKLSLNTTTLANGNHSLYVYGRSTVTGNFQQATPVGFRVAN